MAGENGPIIHLPGVTAGCTLCAIQTTKRIIIAKINEVANCKKCIEKMIGKPGKISKKLR